MIGADQIQSVIGNQVVDSSGDPIGKVGEVYLDDESGQPEWATVNTGLLGTAESFVPLSEASVDGGQLRVPYDKEKVKGAPQVAPDGHLSPEEERDLYRYYGVQPAAGGADFAQSGTNVSSDAETIAAGTARDVDVTDDAMTRSAERLNVGTTRQETGRARLRKFVVTEQQQATVQVSHEEPVVTREPVTEENLAQSLDGPEITEAVHEVTLTSEQPVVSKEAVPVERVRLDKETVTEQQQVSEPVRTEQVEIEDDGRTQR